MVAGFTGALFAATAGLWIFTALLWRTTRRAVIDGEKAIKVATDAAAAANLHVKEAARSANAMEAAAEAMGKSAIASFKHAEAVEEAAMAAWSASGVAEKTAQIMKETAERQLRAYVSAEARSLLSFDTRTPIRITVALQNAGQTPAHKMQFAGSVVIMDHPYKKGTTFDVSFEAEGDVSKTVLHPGKEFMAQAVAKHTVPDEAIVAIRSGTKYRLYAGGVVSYKDAFGKPRLTKFLASAGGQDFLEAIDVARDDLSRAHVSWNHTSEHNEAT